MSENIEKMIDALQSDNMTGAEVAFNDALNDKLTTALDQERINVAGQMFQPEVTPEVEDEVGDFSDEDFEDELETEE